MGEIHPISGPTLHLLSAVQSSHGTSCDASLFSNSRAHFRTSWALAKRVLILLTFLWNSKWHLVLAGEMQIAGAKNFHTSCVSSPGKQSLPHLLCCTTLRLLALPFLILCSPSEQCKEIKLALFSFLSFRNTEDLYVEIHRVCHLTPSGFCKKWQHKWLWFNLIGHLIKYLNNKAQQQVSAQPDVGPEKCFISMLSV